MDDFEQFLKRQPPRSLPPEWRGEILAAAAAAAAGGKNRTARGEGEFPAVHRPPWWLGWLWPSPRAWAGVACAWVVILGLEFAARQGSEAGPELVSASLSRPDFQGIRDILVALEKHERQWDEVSRFQKEPGEPPRKPEETLMPGRPGACNRQDRNQATRLG